MAIKENQGVFYSGSQGNAAKAVGILKGGCADGDVIKFGKLSHGIGITRVSVGTDKANASAVAEVAITMDDGTKKVLGSNLDINNKFTAVEFAMVDVGFDLPELQVTVSGAAVSSASELVLYVDYVTLGTK